MVHRANRPVVRSVSPRAFTLIELLVVIAIIAILIGLVVVIASHVAGSGKQRQTEQTLRSLDTVLQAYINSKGVPSATVLDPRVQTGTNKVIIPIVDGRNFTSNTVDGEYMNTVGLFMLQCKEVPEADQMLKGMDPKIIRDYDPDTQDANPNTPNFAQQPMLPTAFDGWGKPIRYVHPAFKGVLVDNLSVASNPVYTTTDRVLGAAPPGKKYGITNIRRDNNHFTFAPPPIPPYDSDGGMPVGSTPYFYSAGGDGDPGAIEDNVYTARPKYPKF